MPFSDAVIRASPCHLHLLNFACRNLKHVTFSWQISLFGRLHGGDKNPLQTQSIFELPHHIKPVYVNPRLLEKTVSSKYRRPAPLPQQALPHDVFAPRSKELPPHVNVIALDPLTRAAPQCISPGPLDGCLRAVYMRFTRAVLLH
jgi:hypothetical protein